METINFKKKKIKLCANEQQKSYENAKIFYICKYKNKKVKHAKEKKCCKVKDHCQYAEEYRGAGYSICNLMYFNVSCNLMYRVP